jgi:peptidoglycan/LPS O-acetylase OafA/YrhL
MTQNLTIEASAPSTPSTNTPIQRAYTSRLPSLTGLRFPAALLVFAFHAALGVPTLRFLADDALSADFYRAAAQAGGLGVTFFFVLSGFLLTWSARDKDTTRAFWRRRFVKIIPNYVVAWVLAMVLFAGAYTPAWQAIVNLFMLQVWVPDFATNFSVDPPSWSLGAEAIFYAAFPLLLVLIKRIPLDRLKFWTAGVIAAIFLTPALSYLVMPDAPALPGAEATSTVEYWFAYVLPPVRLLDFALGMLVARTVLSGRWRNIGLVWSGLLLVAAYPLASFVPHLYGQRVVFIIPVVLVITAAAMADNEGRPSVFRNRVMTWLGEISFAFYLVHYIVLAYGRILLGDRLFSTPVTIALLIGAIGISILASWALYALVERPITRRWSSKRRPAVAKEEARTDVVGVS